VLKKGNIVGEEFLPAESAEKNFIASIGNAKTTLIAKQLEMGVRGERKQRGA